MPRSRTTSATPFSRYSPYSTPDSEGLGLLTPLNTIPNLFDEPGAGQRFPTNEDSRRFPSPSHFVRG